MNSNQRRKYRRRIACGKSLYPFQRAIIRKIKLLNRMGRLFHVSAGIGKG